MSVKNMSEISTRDVYQNWDLMGPDKQNWQKWVFFLFMQAVKYWPEFLQEWAGLDKSQAGLARMGLNSFGSDLHC